MNQGDPNTPKLEYPLAQTDVELAQVAKDRRDILSLGIRQDVVKGDLVVAEGDLYSRIFTVVSGELTIKKGDRPLIIIQEGEVFGYASILTLPSTWLTKCNRVLTLFYMRPSLVSIECTSDTATLLVIPAYKLQELPNTNFPLSVRFHKKSAQLVYGQIEKVLLSREGLVKGFNTEKGPVSVNEP